MRAKDWKLDTQQVAEVVKGHVQRNLPIHFKLCPNFGLFLRFVLHALICKFNLVMQN